MRHDLQNVDKISKIVHSVADTQKWWVQQIVVVIKCLLCLKFYWLATTCCAATVILTRCVSCVSIPIATFEISNAIWGPREVIVVSWKVFFTFIVIAKKNIKLLSGNFILLYYIIGHWSLWPIDMYISIYLNLNDQGHQSG